MSIFRNSIHIITKHLAYWAIFIAVIFTVFISSVYWISDEIEQRQDEIAQWISDGLGYPVTIQQAGLNWVGTEFKLNIQSLTVFQHNSESELLSLGQLNFGLDIINSIVNREPVLNEISIVGLNVKLIRDQEGRFYVDGFNALRTNETTAEEIDWLSRLSVLNSVNFRSITVDYTDQTTPSLSGHYKLKSAKLNQQQQKWDLTAILRPPMAFGSDISLDAQGQLNKISQNVAWTWQLNANQLQLAPMAELLAWQDVALQKAEVKMAVSGSNIGMNIESLEAQISLANVAVISLQANNDSPSILIDNFRGTFNWKHDKQSWQIAGKQLDLTFNGEKRPLMHFSVENKQGSWSFKANYLALSDFTALALLSSHSPEKVRQQQPAGDIENIMLHYSEELGLESFDFNLVEGELLPWNELPGVSGLTTDVSWSKDGANLTLNSHNITLYPEKWLKGGVFFDSITGQLSYQKNKDKSWRVDSQELRVWNDDLTLQLDGSIEKTAEGKIINDLNLILEDIAVNQWQKYVPKKGFNPLFEEWVTQAFPAGNIVDGTIRWQGDIAKFPYKNKSDDGLFDLALQVEGVQLHYAPGWPDLMNVNAEITGDGNNLIIKSTHGTEAGFDFNEVTTTISQLTEAEPHLVAVADLQGTTERALQFLLKSPLKEKFGKAIATVKATGESRIRFTLNVPLTDLDETKVTGDVSFIDSALYDTSFPKIGITKINGLLQFSTSDVSAKEIHAKFLNQDIVVDVRPTKNDTAILVSGKVATADIKAILPDKVPEFISGETDYKINVIVVEESYGNFYIDAELSSDLKGLQIALPEPVKKEKAISKDFTASFKHVDDSLAYIIKYGDQFNAIVMNKTDLWRGELRFGTGLAVLPESGVKVAGKMTELVLDDWSMLSKESTGEKNPLIESLDNITLGIDSLRGFNQQLTNLTLELKKDDLGWGGSVKSAQSTGSIYIPTDFDNHAVLKMDLDAVRVSLPQSDLDEEDNVKLKTIEQQPLWPAMDINIKSLIIEDMDFGLLNVQAIRSGESWQIESAILKSDVFTATTIIPNSKKKSEWRRSTTWEMSTLQIQAESNNISQLLASFGYQQAIEAENVILMIDLSWPDSPAALFDHDLQGSLTIDVGTGSLKEVEPGAVGRIFGLLSVAAIPQRLSLDFSDLFGEGFSFSSITASFDLANGLATTDDFVLKGAPATVEMSGPIDLKNKLYNQTVTIRPNVSSSLPLAGAVAAGPVGLAAGAAVLLFDKVAGSIFGTEIVNIISYSYDLTGSWDDPQMNISKPKSK